MSTMIIILVALNLMDIDSIKKYIISNKTDQYMDHTANSQRNNTVLKSLPIFIKSDLDKYEIYNKSSEKSQKIIIPMDFLKDKTLKTFDWESVLPPLN